MLTVELDCLHIIVVVYCDVCTEGSSDTVEWINTPTQTCRPIDPDRQRYQTQFVASSMERDDAAKLVEKLLWKFEAHFVIWLMSPIPLPSSPPPALPRTWTTPFLSHPSPLLFISCPTHQNDGRNCLHREVIESERKNWSRGNTTKLLESKREWYRTTGDIMAVTIWMSKQLPLHWTLFLFSFFPLPLSL